MSVFLVVGIVLALAFTAVGIWFLIDGARVLALVSLTGALLAVGVNVQAQTTHDAIDRATDRAGVTVDERPSDDLDRPGDWRIDDAWTRCYVENLDVPGEATLLCSGSTGDFEPVVEEAR